MSNAEHTPGPWRYKSRDGKYLGEKTKWSADYDGKAAVTSYVPVLAGKTTVALAVNVDTSWNDETSCGNARLIAAAPDLLFALSWLVGQKDERPDDYEEQKPLAWAAARAAIAKATGKELAA